MARCSLDNIFATALLSLCAWLYIGAFAIGLRTLNQKIAATCNTGAVVGGTDLLGEYKLTILLRKNNCEFGIHSHFSRRCPGVRTTCRVGHLLRENQESDTSGSRALPEPSCQPLLAHHLQQLLVHRCIVLRHQPSIFLLRRYHLPLCRCHPGFH